MNDIENKNKRSKKPMIIVIVLLIIVFGGLFGWGALRAHFIKQYFANFTPPPVAISTIKAKSTVWQPKIDAVGSLVAVNGVDVAAELPGRIVKISFTNGQMVQQGDPLIQLDDDDDQQDLKGYLAQLKLAEITYKRQSTLFINKAAAAAALDEARANMDQTRSLVGKTRVIIGKKNITAPFAGKVGIREVNLGQYVAAGTKLVSLQAMDPLYAEFSLPQQYLKDLYVGQPITLNIDALSGQTFNGKINAINAEVNSNTRNILVQATIPNPQFKLYPGMYANINVLLPSQQNVIALPQTVVAYNLYGDSVFIIKEDGKDKQGKPILKAFQTYVVTGERRGDEVVIIKGVNPGDEVVTSGQLKLQTGTPVIINNSVDLDKPIFRDSG